MLQVLALPPHLAIVYRPVLSQRPSCNACTLTGCLIVLSSGCHCRTFFSCQATANTYPADLRHLARTPGLLYSSPTFQEPFPVDILALYPLLWCLSQNRKPSLKQVLTIAPESTPSFTVTIALLGCCCRPTPRSVLLVSAVPFARTTEDYYQHSPAMSASLWQQPPHVLLLLLSRLACDDCTLVAKTASRAIIIFNACPRCLRPRGNNRLACY